MNDECRPLHAEIEEIGRQAANRIMAEIAAERIAADSVDQYVVRSAVYAVLFCDSPQLDALLGEADRYTRAEFARLDKQLRRES